MILSGLILLYVMIVAFALCVSVSIRDEYALGLHPYINDKAERWLKELENGDWPQGSGQLKGSDDRYCCLGVACELGGLFEYDYSDYAYYEGDGDYGCLPGDYHKVLGLKGPEGETNIPLSQQPEEFGKSSLAAANDSGEWTFKQLAQVMRSHPELFFQKRF